MYVILALSLLMALGVLSYLSVQSRPVRVSSFTLPRSKRAWIRKPSYFNS